MKKPLNAKLVIEGPWSRGTEMVWYWDIYCSDGTHILREHGYSSRASARRSALSVAKKLGISATEYRDI